MQKYFGSGNKRRHCPLSSLEAALVLASRRQAMSEFDRDDGVSRPTNGIHPIAIAIPLVAAAYLVVAFWVTFLGSELSLILGVVTLIVMMLLGLMTACGAFARNVESDGTPTRNFREFLNGEVDVETGRISGRVALWQIATMPLVVAIGSTLMMACAAATHG
jgi:hypothetical protein